MSAGHFQHFTDIYNHITNSQKSQGQELTFTAGAELIILSPERRSANATATALVVALELVKAALLANMDLIGRRIILR